MVVLLRVRGAFMDVSVGGERVALRATATVGMNDSLFHPLNMPSYHPFILSPPHPLTLPSLPPRLPYLLLADPLSLGLWMHGWDLRPV